MVGQYTKTKGMKRKGKTPPAIQPATKRSRNEVKEQAEEVEVEDHSDSDSPLSEEEQPDLTEQLISVPKRTHAASKQPQEGGEKGQKLFEDVAKNATEGRALARGAREPRGEEKEVEKSSASELNKDKGKGQEKENAPAKWPKKQDGFDRPLSRPRDRAAGKLVKAPDDRKNPKGRRILAQRTVGGQEWYLLDWFPTWVKKQRVVGDLLEAWTGYEAPHKVYHLKNPTSDDSGELMRTLLESVLQMYVEYMDARSHINGIETLANDLFDNDEDWEILDTDDNSGTFAEAMSNDAPSVDQPSAAEILRRTFRNAWNHRPGGESEEAEPEYLYGEVLVTYNGWLDDKSPDNQFQPENGVTVRSLIEPMFHPMLWNEDYMNVAKWDAERADGTKRSVDEVNEHIRKLSVTLSRVVRDCPFMLKKPWPLMLIALFWWDEELRTLIHTGDFQFTLRNADEANETTDYDSWNDSWEWRTTDKIIYTYIDECDWEWRCMDEVWTTFLEAQKFIRASVKAANSPADNDDPSLPERSSGNGNEKEKHSPPKPLLPRGGGRNDAPTRQPQGGPPPMSGANGEGPSSTNIRSRKRPVIEQRDSDNDDLYELPDAATIAAVKNANKKRERTLPDGDNDETSEALPRKKPTSAPSYITALQLEKPAAPKPTESRPIATDPGISASYLAAATASETATAAATATSGRPRGNNRAYWSRVLGTGATVVDD
ncbi:hypothetical protein N0V87_008637 [Didymella glomerata]|uniref:Uncharacterized protein n=1 Tax=Didymella glomerata TaxID=749621 RepID=A0A9W8WSM2_9PLEO|nr:hypothetical protein N0V87_008637 [Didymella glomerata]